MSKKTFSGLSIGSSSILAIFVLLCLITFSTLSMVSANADYRLSLKMSNRMSAYYEATSIAENKLGEIDGILRKTYQKSSDAKTYYSTLLTSRLFSEDIVLSTGKSGEFYLDYAVPFNDSQELHVRLLATYPDGSQINSCYSIETWKLETIREWTPDEKIKLLDP